MKTTFSPATKSDKKSLMRFYKQQNYSAGLLGLDKVYLLKCSSEMIGAVIISTLAENNQQSFLHGLVIERAFRQKKLASQLLTFVVTQDKHQEIFCFADKTLSHFYQQNGFGQITQQQLPEPLLIRYLRVKKTKKNLLVFTFHR
ncbi:GNAT family N-acetyltransferase [Colwellia hornerae]|uniref:GNAT family N-acetyltransferase n=1 Tax=Colwellia hornerae TaxID=89402 RepID=A0A5C6QQU2_9GAMM|nr:GNAT family N-acetyltransferase [Colwellia hornerae]TWX55687.1 GNAT family N-acetyltransferase [Colwellia hornerae]TWX61897.1 GNAT family N-acetyltransferase [Colwellia hornerae]TWX71229.1 GNAT family N-acetyltransferase [Colwellia hornerae]